MERYRSGHNEAVLKTVWGQPRVGSNPTLSANNLNIKEENLIISFDGNSEFEISAWRSTQEAEEDGLLNR